METGEQQVAIYNWFESYGLWQPRGYVVALSVFNVAQDVPSVASSCQDISEVCC